jgi:hypothetical protein
MAPAPRTPWRRRGAGPLALALLAALAGPPAARAQGAEISYTQQPNFRIPFTVDPSDRRTQQVLLHVSEDDGRTYQYVASAAPSEKGFRFTARHDGWYWFTVQTQDQEGRLFPATLTLAQPGLKVCVDTRPPTVGLRPAESPGYPLAVQWDVRDETSGPDVYTLRIDYRPSGGGTWTPLAVQQAVVGQHAWTPAAAAAQYDVRLQVRDKAGNAAEQTVTLAPGAGRAAGVAPGPVAPPPAASAPGNLIMVNTRQVRLNYSIEDVGPSKVKGVEVWWTRDARAWEKYPQEAPPEPPFVCTLPGEGRYGFTLIAKSGVGNAERRPQPGDLPQIWVELDETKPVVRLVSVEVGRGAEEGTLAVRWTAADKNLAANPITISYRDEDGQWKPVASNLPNDGRYVWRMPPGVPYQFAVRVEASDQAGNVGSDETRQAVAVDLKVPKVRGVTVEPAKGAGGAPSVEGVSPPPPADAGRDPSRP